MHKFISSLLLLSVMLCLCSCIDQSYGKENAPSHSDTTQSTQDTNETTNVNTEASLPNTQTTYTEFISTSDIIPLYDTDSSEMLVITSEHQNSEVYLSNYYHLKHAKFRRNNVFTVCTDEIEMNQGNHYAAYIIKDGEIVPIESSKVSKSYDLFGTTYHIEFEYAVCEGQTIFTYCPVSENFTDPGPFREYPGDYCCLLQLCELTDDNNLLYHQMILNLETGDLTDLLDGIDPKEQTEIIDKQANNIAFLDEDRFVIKQVSGSVYYVDTKKEVVCNLDELLDTTVQHCSIVGESIICWNKNGDFWKVDTSDLASKLLLTGLRSFSASGIWNDKGSKYVIYMTNKEYHVYNTETEQDQIIAIPSNWDIQLAALHFSPDGTKVYYAVQDENAQYQILIFDFERMKFTELVRTNENSVEDCMISWTPDSKIIIHANKFRETYVYEIK